MREKDRQWERELGLMITYRRNEDDVVTLMHLNWRERRATKSHCWNERKRERERKWTDWNPEQWGWQKKGRGTEGWRWREEGGAGEATKRTATQKNYRIFRSCCPASLFLTLPKQHGANRATQFLAADYASSTLGPLSHTLALIACVSLRPKDFTSFSTSNLNSDTTCESVVLFACQKFSCLACWLWKRLLGAWG